MINSNQEPCTDKLGEVKRILGTRYRKKIADRTGYSTSRVSQIFKEGDVNHEILQVAINMVEEIKANSKKIESL